MYGHYDSAPIDQDLHPPSSLLSSAPLSSLTSFPGSPQILPPSSSLIPAPLSFQLFPRSCLPLTPLPHTSSSGLESSLTPATFSPQLLPPPSLPPAPPFFQVISRPTPPHSPLVLRAVITSQLLSQLSRVPERSCWDLSSAHTLQNSSFINCLESQLQVPSVPRQHLLMPLPEFLSFVGDEWPRGMFHQQSRSWVSGLLGATRVAGYGAILSLFLVF